MAVDNQCGASGWGRTSWQHDIFCPGDRYDQIAAAGGPADQWDALPTNAKLQIIIFVGLLELYSESANVRSTRPRDNC